MADQRKVFDLTIATVQPCPGRLNPSNGYYLARLMFGSISADLASQVLRIEGCCGLDYLNAFAKNSLACKALTEARAAALC